MSRVLQQLLLMLRPVIQTLAKGVPNYCFVEFGKHSVLVPFHKHQPSPWIETRTLN